MPKRYIFKFTEPDPIIDAWLSCQQKNNESFKALIYDIAKQYGAIDYTKKDINTKPGRNKIHDILDEVQTGVIADTKRAHQTENKKDVSNVNNDNNRSSAEEIHRTGRIEQPVQDNTQTESESHDDKRPLPFAGAPDRPSVNGASIFENHGQNLHQNRQTSDDMTDSGPETAEEAGALDDIMSLFD